MFKCDWKQLAWLGVTAAVVLIDQLSKAVALHSLTHGEIKTFLPFFNFSLAFNRGAAFSFLNEASGWQNTFFMSIACIFCIVMIIWMLRHPKRKENACMALIMGGALGNLVDRFHYGYVVDFIDLHSGIYHWPMFNLADSAICIGVALLLIFNAKQGVKAHVK